MEVVWKASTAIKTGNFILTNSVIREVFPISPKVLEVVQKLQYIYDSSV